jgi:lipoate---protein ligase
MGSLSGSAVPYGVTAAPRCAWLVERRAGDAAALHGPWPEASARQHRAVALCTVSGPSAIVLGSTQSPGVVNAERASRSGVDVVRRRSGGGAVLVAPASQVWLDTWIPRGDPLWDDDVIRSSWWLGETWTRALGGLGARQLSVHRGRARRAEWSDVVCFAGLGPGEVTAGAAKLVGVAQRRTREGARFHAMAALSWEPAPLVALLALDDAQTGQATGALGPVATGVRAVVDEPLGALDGARLIAAVEDALVHALR